MAENEINDPLLNKTATKREHFAEIVEIDDNSYIKHINAESEGILNVSNKISTEYHEYVSDSCENVQAEISEITRDKPKIVIHSVVQLDALKINESSVVTMDENEASEDVATGCVKYKKKNRLKILDSDSEEESEVPTLVESNEFSQNENEEDRNKLVINSKL